jgi:hypothetical protein
MLVLLLQQLLLLLWEEVRQQPLPTARCNT